MRDLKYHIPKVDPASDVQSTSQHKTMTKADDEEKLKTEVDDTGFKIPQGIALHNKKKLDTEEHRKIVDRILARDLDPSSILVDVVKVRHELMG